MCSQFFTNGSSTFESAYRLGVVNISLIFLPLSRLQNEVITEYTTSIYKLDKQIDNYKKIIGKPETEPEPESAPEPEEAEQEVEVVPEPETKAEPEPPKKRKHVKVSCTVS